MAAWHLVGTGKVSFAPKDAGRVACGSHKTLSALGRWFGFGQDQILSSLIGSAGCQFLGLVWVYHYGRYGSSLKRQAEAGLAPFTDCSGLHPDRAVSDHVIALARWGHLPDAPQHIFLQPPGTGVPCLRDANARPLDLAHTKRPFEISLDATYLLPGIFRRPDWIP